MNSDPVIPILIALVGIAIVILLAWLIRRKNHTDDLRQKFGPEYDYAIHTQGDLRKAEQALEERSKKVNELNIHNLENNFQERYTAEWMDIQSLFVDDPKGAVEWANRLITEVMVARGFPVEDFEQRAADLSVLFPEQVRNYRTANEIVIKNQNDGTSTEELRQALVDYHSIFEVLLCSELTRETETIK
jgi:hypothetical protein